MSDPHALPDAPKTRRAEPLQPDRPGQGLDKLPTAPSPDPSTEESARRQADQALENVREGYGGPPAPKD